MDASRSLIVRVVGITIVLTLLAASAAAADETAVIVSGSAPARQRAVAAVAITSGPAAVTGNTIVAPKFSAKDLATITGCISDHQPWTCVKPTLQTLGIQQLALVSLDPQPGNTGSPVIVITEQVLAESLDTPLGGRRYCDHCTDDVLGQLASELTRDLLREAAVRGGRTVVSIKSVPRGARITFDHKLVGATDTLLNTYPGIHLLGLELDGYQPLSRSVVTTDGKTADVNETLRPTTGPAVTRVGISTTHPGHDPAPGQLTRIAPWLLVSVGGAAVVTGGILILVDSKPSHDPTSEHSQYYYSTQGPGIVTAIAGALSIGGGLLWLHHRSATSSTVTAAPLRGGAALNWSKSF